MLAAKLLSHLLKDWRAIPLDILMTALQAILLFKQLYMQHLSFFFNGHDTLSFIFCGIILAKGIQSKESS